MHVYVLEKHQEVVCKISRLLIPKNVSLQTARRHLQHSRSLHHCGVRACLPSLDALVALR